MPPQQRQQQPQQRLQHPPPPPLQQHDGSSSSPSCRSSSSSSSGGGGGRRGRRGPQRRGAAAAALLLLAAWAGCAAGTLLSSRPGNVLTMVLTDCGKYQDWQTIAAAFAWRQSDQPGSVIRVANCNEQDTKNYDKRMLDYVATHMAKQYAWYAPLRDWYAAYNKPGAVVDYFEHVTPAQEWVAVLDSDMLLRKPFVPETLNLTRGWAYGAHYDYLVGVNNQLALRHVPEIPPRNDTIAGPLGRRGDRVGGPYYMHRDDLAHLAPQWLNYTRIMRNDFEAYADSGDTASKKGDRIWIAEMYGYSFGAAKSDVWHKWGHDFMLYPSYAPGFVPHVLHYGLIYRIDDWQFDKHWYFDFDAHACPPWDLAKEKPKHGIFPPPPHPDKLNLDTKDYVARYRDLLGVSVIALVNAALCDYHVRNCPPSAQLTQVCDQAFSLYHAIEQALREIEWSYECTNHKSECQAWVERGECEKMKMFMTDHCKLACKLCTPPGPRPSRPSDALLTVAGISKEIGVAPVLPGMPQAQAQAQAQPVAAGAGVDAAATAALAAAEAARKAAEQQIATERALAQRAAAEKEAAERAATAARTAAEQATAAAAAVAAAKKALEEQLGKAALAAKYPASTLTYAALVKRCTDMAGLSDVQLKECVRAASFKLAFTGPEAAAAAPGAPGTASTGGGAEGAPNGAALRGGQDLAALHAASFQPGRARYQNVMLAAAGGASGSGGVWTLVGQGAAVAAAAGVVYYAYGRFQAYRLSRAKGHSRDD